MIAGMEPEELAARLNMPFKPRKINCGCGELAIIEDGLLNIDMTRPRWVDEHPEFPFLLWDVRKGLPFDDASIEFIVAHHMFEHLTYDEGDRFLLECKRVLVPGGAVSIVVPDYRFVANVYQSARWAWRDYANALLFGTRDENLQTGSYHCAAYDDVELLNSAAKAGLVPELRDANTNPYTPIKAQWHINVMMTKPGGAPEQEDANP